MLVFHWEPFELIQVLKFDLLKQMMIQCLPSVSPLLFELMYTQFSTEIKLNQNKTINPNGAILSRPNCFISEELTTTSPESSEKLKRQFHA